jgi:RNA polymerase sigma factor (sigma-70 family)
MADQHTLLADYVANASERAFSEIVHGYIDLVYSTALRLVNGDTHRAEDVVQTVFADLARLARTLPRDVMLGGWLHRRTFHVATTIMRDERRRANRERQACEMNALQNDSDDGFEQIAPYLDEAINELNDRERAAIVLRYFERRDLRAVGAALGSNEDAAQKSVSRAVDKLRSHFERRGVVISSALIVSALAGNAVQAAPAGLASTVAAASLAGAAVAGTIGFTTTLTKIILMKKTTTIITLCALAALVTSIAVVKFKHAAANAPATEKSLKQGLVLHLNFDRDETLGTVADTSGKENTGRATGVRWTPDGKKGGAYEFTADGDQVIVPNSKSLNPGHFTLSAWIKTTTGDYYWRRIFDKSYTKGFALSVAGDWKSNDYRGCVSMEIGPGTHFTITKTKVNDGQWHHVASTFNGTNEVIYLDGRMASRLKWNRPGKAGTTDFDLVIGCNRSNLDKSEDDLGMSFRGVIDEPMVWNRALSEKEIAYLYQSQNGSPASAVVQN